jgi:hypothetical protein
MANGNNIDDGTGIYLPRFNIEPRVPHYYGDIVRRIFIGAAAAIVIFAPFFGGNVLLLPFEIIGAVVLVILAGLTTPKNMSIMIVNAVAAALGVVIYETTALYAYSNGDVWTFLAHETLVVTFVFALYFSMKTVRAMQLGQIGKHSKPGEFLKGWEDMGQRYTRDPKQN